MLAGRVDRRAGAPFVTEGRGDVDDAAAALSLHDPQFMLHAEDGPQDVGVEGRGVALGGLLRRRPRLAFGARGVDRDIQPAEALNGLIDEVAHILVVTNVGADELGFSACGAQFGDERCARVVMTAGGDDLGASLGVSERSGAGDAGQRRR